jgi:hypothetical protein
VKYSIAIPNSLFIPEVMSLQHLSPAQLRQAAILKEQIIELEGELESILGTSAAATESKRIHWTQTPAGRARLARSVQRSWRTRRLSSKPSAAPASNFGKKLHWTQTPAGRIKMDKIRARRWAKR